MFQTRPRELSDGEAIFEEGAPSTHAFLVESGEVEVSVIRREDGRRVRLATLGPGELVGEMSLVDERPRSASAHAIGRTAVQPFTRDEFEDLILRRPDASLRLIRALFERLRLMNARVERLETGPGLPGDEAGVDADAGVEPGARPGRRPTLTASLVPLTDQAGTAVPADGLRVRNFPMRLGRDEGGALDLNELQLKDSKPYQVSRNHCSIERDGERLVVRDRGSYAGTVVNGRKIGGKRAEGAAVLVTGDNEIILGRTSSPWRFLVAVRDEDAATADQEA